jgi:hypothetical protein
MTGANNLFTDHPRSTLQFQAIEDLTSPWVGKQAASNIALGAEFIGPLALTKVSSAQRAMQAERLLSEGESQLILPRIRASTGGTGGTGGLGMPNVPWTYGALPPGSLGETDKFGNIIIQNGLSGQTLIETVRHEAVHRWLSPGSGRLQGLRATLGEGAYNRSQLLRYLEEAMAETYATGSLRQGLSFPVTNGYVTVRGVVIEGSAYLVIVGGSSYGAYKLGEVIGE